tara:strand:- start:1490 stop:2257 length:768 start_codon:yes stop_codon:yes gene_type:complete
MTEIIKMLGGGTLTYSPGRHQYHWHDADGQGGKVDLSVSSVASEYAVPFGVSSGWAAKQIKLELLRETIPSAFDGPEERIAWAKQVCGAPRRFTHRAASIGTAVHSHIESLAHGLEPDLSDDEDVAKCQRGLGEWFKRNVAEALHIERRLYSPRWRIAGTCDMVARLHDGTQQVLDWKGVTDLSASIKAGHIGQLTAYREMLTEAGEQIDGCTLVRFSRATGEVEADTLKNHPENLAAFEAALRLARYKPQIDIL